MKKKEKGAFSIIPRFAKGSYGFFLFAALCAVISIFFNFLTPQVIRITVDSVIGIEPFALPDFLVGFINALGGREALRQNLILCGMLGVIFSIVSGLSNYGCRVNMAKGAEGMIYRLRNFLFSHIQRLPYKWHISIKTGDIIQRCTSDVDLVRNFTANQALEVFRTIVLASVAITLMFSMNVKLTLVALAFIPIVLAYSMFFYPRIGKRFQVADEAEGDLTAMVQENLTGVRVVRAFGRESHEIEKFKEKNNLFARLWVKLGALLGFYWGMGDLVTGLQIMCAVVFGSIEAVNGNITLGEFLVFVSYNQSLVWPIRSLGRILSELSKTKVSLGRLKEILDEEEEMDPENALTPPMNKDIEFSHVSFAYEESEPVLKDINFKIKAGTTCGILGGTGSGKSTLMHLFNRLYDVEDGFGHITVGGVDIKDMKRDWVRKNVGLVLQEPFLYSKTIEENISIAKESLDLDGVRRYANIAAIDESICEFPDSYDTIVGERGVTLSGGQKQRVAIARTLSLDPPIMVFDDSLSALDSETDMKIRGALDHNLGSTTVVLISHRVNSLQHADQIIVMDDGKIAEQGTHEELLKKNGIYRRVYDIQSLVDLEIEEEVNS